MKYSKVFLDTLSMEYLELLLLKEKEYTSRYGNKRKDQKNYFRSKLLNMLVFFEEIDCYSNATYINSELLVRYGLVKEGSQLVTNTDEYGIELIFHSNIQLNNSDKKLYESSKKTAIELLRLFERKVILEFTKKQDPKHLSFQKMRSNEKALFQINTNYSLLLEYLELEDPLNNEREFIFKYTIDDKFPHLFEFATYLELLFYSLCDSIYWAKKNQSPIGTVLNFGTKANSTLGLSNPIEHLNYLVKTNLKEEIKYFPHPKNFDDLLRIRERKEIFRFREVVSNWLISISNGDLSVEMEIRKDIRKANKELKNINGWIEYKDSPINFVINTVGGHIPILSNILSIVSSVGYLYEKRVNSRHNWVSLIS